MSENIGAPQRFGGRGPFNLPYSRVVEAAGFAFVSGQVGVDAEGVVVSGGIEAETNVALRRVVEALALAGYAREDLVKVTVYLADARDFQRFNKAYGAFFPDSLPARTTIVTPLVIDAKVEIEALAFRPVRDTSQ